MTKAALPRDGISLVIPARNAAEKLKKTVLAWDETLRKFGRDFEIVVIDDASGDGTSQVLAELVEAGDSRIRALRQSEPGGFGACLRNALTLVKYPLLCYAAPNYTSSATDLRNMVERIEVRDEILHKQPDLISAARPGHKAPSVIYWSARAWHLCWRIAAGIEMQPAPPWLGWREFLNGNLVGWVFAVPLVDVNSEMKLVRTEFLKRFPIQSDGDFVHTELVAKATFLTSIIDEIPLSQPPEPKASGSSLTREFWRLFKNPDFGSLPIATDPKSPPPSGPVPVMS